MKVKITCGGQEFEVTKKLGHSRNNWRMREVGVWEHPTDPSKVITVGVGFGGGFDCNAVEDRDVWVHVIGNFHHVYN